MNFKTSFVCESQTTNNIITSATFLEREQELIDELRVTFGSLPDFAENMQGEKRWLDNIRRLRELVTKEDLRRFLQWDVIKRTMEVGDADFIEGELNFLRDRSNWSRWQQAINEVPIGKPTLSRLYPASSGNLIHHAYHVAQFEDRTGVNIRDVRYVFEFGGGYGGMYRLIHNLDFEGKYVIFDFPEFSALQRYFIQSIGLEIHTVESFKTAKNGVICISDLPALEMLLAECVPEDNGLFLATWSLSECPLSFRSEILSLLTQFKNFLIAYQGQFEGNDNVDFFDNWRNGKQQFDWHHYKIGHIPNQFYGDNFYLFGKINLG